jgi:glycosyltransferase involved in cell wall biosynthesis
MHILIVPSWYPDNVEDANGVFFRDQALALKAAGHRVGVIAPLLKSLRKLAKKPTRARASFYELDQGMPTYRRTVWAVLPRVPYGNYLLVKQATRALLAAYIKDHGKPDLIHAHAAIFAGAAVAELARSWGIPVVHTEHSSGFAKGVYTGWQARLAAKAYRQSRICMAVSPALAELVANQLPATRGRWVWMPNMVSDRFTTPEAARLQEWRDAPPVFLNLALMKEGKGHLDLIRAFHSLLSSGYAAELWLAGDGPLRATVEAEVRRLKLAPKVRFLGLVAPSAVPALLTRVDALVVPSHSETFGVVAAEALMTGLPVVATRCGGPECIIEDGDGILAPPGEPESLAAAMRQLSENLASYDRRAIARRARERFSGPAIAARLAAEYQRALSDPPAAE